MKKLSNRDYIISSGIVIVRKNNNDYLFLLLRSGKYYDFPKGVVEIGEDFLETAIRETEEETTIIKDSLEFKWGKEKITTEPYLKNSKVATYFIAETAQNKIMLPINPEIGKAEHDSYVWATYERAKKLTCDRVGKVLDWAYSKIME